MPTFRFVETRKFPRFGQAPHPAPWLPCTIGDKRLTSKRLRGTEKCPAVLFLRWDLKRKKSTAQLSTFFSTDAWGTLSRYFLAGFGDYFPPGE